MSSARAESRRVALMACAIGWLWTTAAPAAPKVGAWSIGRPEPAAVAPATPAMAVPAAEPPRDHDLYTVRLKPTDVTAPDGSTVVQELEITVHAPGPPVWRVTRGAAEVVIVGGLSPLPHALNWDRRRVERALNGAGALLMPPPPKIGVFEAMKLVVQAGGVHWPGAATLESKLPPALHAKFLDAARIAAANPRQYAHWKPAAAGFLLIGDFRKAAGFSDAKPGTTIERMAKTANVPIRYASRLNLSPVFDSLVSLPPERQLACLDAASDDVIWESGHAIAAAQAWSVGRLAAVRANWSTNVLDRCLLQNVRVQQLLERGTADATRAVNEALSRPGKTVALVDLHFLLTPNGLLDRLRAQGATVTSPLE